MQIQALIQLIRPATLWVAIVPLWVASAMAWRDKTFTPGICAAILVASVAIQIATNAFNDWADFRTGADNDERLGPIRSLQSGSLSEKSVLAVVIICYVVAIACGIYLVSIGGWPIVAIGALALTCGIAYTGGPFPLAYLGIADVFVFVFFGLIAVSGSYYLYSGVWRSTALYYGASLGCIATAILVVNNIRDRHSDRKVDKKTLPVRLGVTFARWQYATLLLMAPALVVWTALQRKNWMVLLVLLCLPFCMYLIRAVWQKDGCQLNPVLGQTAKLELLFGLLLGVAIVL